MINNFYKTIHNKYSRFFRFIFFLRYLFLIFLISFTLFLAIPKFFDYEKRIDVIKTHLHKNYNFKISKYEKINFNILPSPNLEIKNVEINLDLSPIQFNIKNLKIFPRFLSIYNYKEFTSNKVVLKDSKIILESTELKFFIKKVLNQKNKLLIDNLDLKINNKNNFLIALNDISFSNYGYNKNNINGEIFNKKFNIKINNNLKNLEFKLINSGISAVIDIEDKINNNIISGIFKSKILNTNLRFNFDYDHNTISIYNSFFRSKNLSFKSKNSIIFDPFFSIKSNINVEDINLKILKKFNFDKLFQSKDIIKKINTNNEINYVSKKFSRNLIDTLNLKTDLVYGRLNYSKKFSMADSLFQCEGNINLFDEYPILFFDCSIISNNKKKLLKKFLINSKNKNEILNLNVEGNLNILNRKINLKKLSMNKNYKASKEDLKFFKEKFENILFDKSFLEIFDYKKIKKFILEIS